MRTDRFRRPARHARRAFSLVELIVAVTIMAILAALVVPRVSQWIGFTKAKTARADAETISNQVRMYMTAKGMSTLPSDFELVELTEGDGALLNKNQIMDPGTARTRSVSPAKSTWTLTSTALAPMGKRAAKAKVRML